MCTWATHVLLGQKKKPTFYCRVGFFLCSKRKKICLKCLITRRIRLYLMEKRPYFMEIAHISGNSPIFHVNRSYLRKTTHIPKNPLIFPENRSYSKKSAHISGKPPIFQKIRSYPWRIAHISEKPLISPGIRP